MDRSVIMTEQISEAAATGAAAAVEAVQQQQEVEAAAVNAEIAAEIAEGVAEVAAVEAQEATSTADAAMMGAAIAADTAATAQETAVAAGEHSLGLEGMVRDGFQSVGEVLAGLRAEVAELKQNAAQPPTQTVVVPVTGQQPAPPQTQTGESSERRHRFGH
jgi:hypothetical protein